MVDRRGERSRRAGDDPGGRVECQSCGQGRRNRKTARCRADRLGCIRGDRGAFNVGRRALAVSGELRTCEHRKIQRRRLVLADRKRGGDGVIGGRRGGARRAGDDAGRRVHRESGRQRGRDSETAGDATDVQWLVGGDRMSHHVDRRAGGVAFEDRSGHRELQIVDRTAEAPDVERRGTDAELDIAAAVAGVGEAAEAETEVARIANKCARLVDEVVQHRVVRGAQHFDPDAVARAGLLRWRFINRWRGEEIDDVARA